MRSPRGPEDAGDPVVDVVAGAGLQERFRQRIHQFLVDACPFDGVRCPRLAAAADVLAGVAGRRPVGVGNPNRKRHALVRDHAPGGSRYFDGVGVVQIKEGERVALRDSRLRFLQQPCTALAAAVAGQRMVVVELRDLRAIRRRFARGRARLRRILLVVRGAVTLYRRFHDIEPFDLRLHRVVGGVAGDHVHLGGCRAQVERDERVVEHLAFRVEHEYLVSAAAVVGGYCRRDRWRCRGARNREQGDDFAAAAAAGFLAGALERAGVGRPFPVVGHVHHEIGLERAAAGPVVHTDHVDPRRRRSSGPGHVLGADPVGDTVGTRFQVVLAAAVDHLSTPVDLVAVRVHHVQVEIGVGVPGDGDLQVAGTCRYHFERMTLRRPDGPVRGNAHERKTECRECLDPGRDVPYQPIRRHGAGQVDLVVALHVDRQQQLVELRIRRDADKDGSAAHQGVISHHLDTRAIARLRRRLQPQDALGLSNVHRCQQLGYRDPGPHGNDEFESGGVAGVVVVVRVLHQVRHLVVALRQRRSEDRAEVGVVVQPGRQHHRVQAVGQGPVAAGGLGEEDGPDARSHGKGQSLQFPQETGGGIGLFRLGIHGGRIYRLLGSRRLRRGRIGDRSRPPAAGQYYGEYQHQQCYETQCFV